MAPQEQSKGNTVDNKDREATLIQAPRAEESMSDDEDSICNEYCQVPRGCLLEHARPSSPTAVTDFPKCIDDPTCVSLTEHLRLQVSPTTVLPKIPTLPDQLDYTVNAIQQTQNEWMDLATTPPTQVMAPTLVADIGTFGHTYSHKRDFNVNEGKMADSGANCCMTNNWKLLEHIKLLPHPIQVGIALEKADSTVEMTACKHVGTLPIECDDGHIIHTPCFYNPHATDTIISPQAIIDQSPEFEKWIQVGRKVGEPGMLMFQGYAGTRKITLHQRNGLYYCNAIKYNIYQAHRDEEEWEDNNTPVIHRIEIPTTITPPERRTKKGTPQTSRFRPTTKAKILESETWSLRLGACHETQLKALPQHALGLPKHFEFHPFRYIDFKEQARIRKQPVGRNPITVSERGKQFHMDFGFLRASSEDFRKTNLKTDRIVESFDGYTSYLLVVDKATRYAWIFLTKTKDPPVGIISLFLEKFGNENGGMIRVDQGGELARSEEWRSMALNTYRYVVEPTGADSPSQNGQAERYNESIATTTRTLLYGADLTARYWSAAAIHAVYLLNRRPHSAINKTPFEAWWDVKPDLSALKVFGSRVCVKVSGKRRAKLNRHDFTGIFIGYTATDDNIRYIDVYSGVVKTSHHAVFDEAWYLQSSRPPAAQLLYDMGMEPDIDQIEEELGTTELAPYPPIPHHAPHKLPTKAVIYPIPLRISPQPSFPVYAASAAKTKVVPEDPAQGDLWNIWKENKEEVFRQIYLSPTPYHDAFEERMDIRRWHPTDHPTAGLRLVQENGRVMLINMDKSTPASRIPRWRSRLKGAWLMQVDGMPVHSVSDVQISIKRAKLDGKITCDLLLAHAELRTGLSHDGVPQVSIDQLNTRFFVNKEFIASQQVPIIASGGVYTYAFSKLTRGKLLKQQDWNEWQESERLQLDQYQRQFMFGTPVCLEDRNNVFHLVWTYTVKELDKRKKARCACDGSTRGGKVRVLDYTYANCVDHTASRMFYAISAAENLLIFGADVCNAFSEAPAPKQGFYIQPDRAFCEWWIYQGNPPIPEGYVIPVRRAMQGHPESPRLWEKWCDKMIRQHQFTPTTHEPCLYTGIWQGEKCYFKRQVDDFEFATTSIDLATSFYDAIDDHLTMPIKRQGLVTLFNGIDILQSRNFIKLSAETYIEKMGAKYLDMWHKEVQMMAERPLPIPTNETFLKAFNGDSGDPEEKVQKELQRRFKFNYRSGVGELIYAMVTCRPDISAVTVKCAQHSTCPADIHFQAVKHAIKYLVATRKDGIYFWRATPLTSLPEHPLPLCATALHGPLPPHVHRPQHACEEMHAYVDSDWATCPKTRRSFTGSIIKMAGGTIAYKTKLQPTVALSSTEAEFMAACDTGKMILFIRSILWDLGIPQQAATVMYEDNDACTAMANAQKPTTRTRHMDIRYFALAEWVERDIMILERVHTSINLADHMTKILDRTLFYRHVDHIMGHIPPLYSPCYGEFSKQMTPDLCPEHTIEDMDMAPAAAAAAKCSTSFYPWPLISSSSAQYQSIPLT